MTEQSLRHAIEAVRTRITAELERELNVLAERHETDLLNVRLATEREVEARYKAAVSAGPDLSEFFRQLDAESTVSGVLTATVNCAARAATRAALFVGPMLDRWTSGVTGSDGPEARLVVLQAAATSAQPVKDERSIAVPLVLDWTSVAVLYAEHDAAPDDGWSRPIELLARYASARLAYLTAWRTAQVQQRLTPAPRSTTTGHSAASETQSDEAEQAARRYARLLVSEIKLYNEAAVREGREKRDLGRRLASDIERARRLYEERISSTVPGRSQYFQQELVQTLAGGDPSLLG